MYLYNTLYGLVNFHISIRQWPWPKSKGTNFAFRSILSHEADKASEKFLYVRAQNTKLQNAFLHRTFFVRNITILCTKGVNQSKQKRKILRWDMKEWVKIEEDQGKIKFLHSRQEQMHAFSVSSKERLQKTAQTVPSHLNPVICCNSPQWELRASLR